GVDHAAAAFEEDARDLLQGIERGGIQRDLVAARGAGADDRQRLAGGRDGARDHRTGGGHGRGRGRGGRRRGRALAAAAGQRREHQAGGGEGSGGEEFAAGRHGGASRGGGPAASPRRGSPRVPSSRAAWPGGGA